MALTAACGESTEEVNEGDAIGEGGIDEGEAGEESEAPDDAEHVITFSHNQPLESPEHIGAEEFKEYIEEASDGEVHVDLYPDSQLGSLREQVESTQLGEIDITMQPSAVVSPFVDDVKVVDLPYLLPNDYDAIFEIFDGELGDELLERLEQGQFKGLGYWFGGFKLLTTDGVEIREPDDMQGLDMRSMEAEVLLAQYEQWGANPVGVPYAEVYNSLQQGVVDGQENPLQTVILQNFYEVQDQAINSYHGTMTYLLMTNLDWFEGLPDDIQQLVVEAEEEARMVAREAKIDMEDEYIEELENMEDINYYELTDEEIEVFREASLPVHEEEYDEEWQQDYLQRLYDAIEESTGEDLF